MSHSPKSQIEQNQGFVQRKDNSSSISGQEGQYNLYNNNAQGTGNNTNAAIREEQKQAALLSGEFESVYQEAKLMIKQKQYKKVLSLLEQYRPEKGFSVSQNILVNRRMIVSSNKILKLYSHDVDVESEDKIIQLIDKTYRLISESYRFLNLYICKILPNMLNDAFLNDASHLTSDDENDRFPIKRIKSTFEQLHSYPQSITQKEKEEKAAAAAKIKENSEDKKYQLTNDKQSAPLTDVKLYKMINVLYNKPLKIDYELDQYIIQLLSFCLRVSNIYKRSMKFKLAFFYLKEANRIVDEVSTYQNPEIIHICAKLRLTIANFYYEASRTKIAIEYTENALFLMQFEYRLRICDKQPNSQISKKENGRQMNCIKTIIIALINLCLFYESICDYRRLYETSQLAEFISQKFLKGIDEVKKYMGKIFQEICKRYEQFLTELGELDLICRKILWKEANQLLNKWDEQQDEQDIFNQKFNQIFYDKFKVRDLNQKLKINIKKHEKKHITIEQLGKIEEKKNKEDQNQQKKQKNLQNQANANPNDQIQEDLNQNNQEYNSKNYKLSSNQGQSPPNRDSNQLGSWNQFQSQSISLQSKILVNTENSGKIRQNTDEKNIYDTNGFKSPKSASIQFQNLDNIKVVATDQDEIKQETEDSKMQAKDNKHQSSMSQSHFNEKQTNISQSDENEDDDKSQINKSFFDLGADFFLNNDLEEQWKFQVKQNVSQQQEVNSVQNKQINQNQEKQQQQSSAKKYVAIDPHKLKKKPPAIKQHPQEYKSKVLTSNDYFDPYVRQVTPKKALKTIIEESIEKYQKLLRYPRNAQEFNVKYLEEHIKNIVVDKVEQENIKDIKQVYQHFEFLLDRDEMDKKKMEFARKIVHLKIFRDLNPKLKDQYNDLYLDHKLEIERNGEFQVLLANTIRELDKIKQFKKERNVDLVIDKGLNVDLNDEMTKALESKLQEKKKKKNLREVIFKYKDDFMFAKAKNLKTVFQTYLGYLREIERNERIKKEQQERDKHKEEEMKYNEQQKQNLNKQDSQEQIQYQTQKQNNNNKQSQQNSDQQNAQMYHHNHGIQGSQSQIQFSMQHINQTPKSSQSILKKHNSIVNNQANKKSLYQNQVNKNEKVLQFQQDEAKKKAQETDKTLKVKAQSLKEMRNKDLRIRSAMVSPSSHNQHKQIRDIIDKYEDDEDLQKHFQMAPQFKKIYRNSLYDMNFCKFDKKQIQDELERQRKAQEERQKYQKEMENMMMYYGSSNMQEPEEPSYFKGTNIEEFSKTLKDGNFTRNEQRKKLQLEELKKREQILYQRYLQQLQYYSKAQNKIITPSPDPLPVQTKQKSHVKKNQEIMHQFQTATQTPKDQPSLPYYYDFQRQRQQQSQELFKKQSNKVIKIVAAEVESNLRETSEEYFQIKYKIEKNKEYIEDQNFGRQLASQYCQLKQSTFQPSDLFIQPEKPKNLIDITKLKMKLMEQKKNEKQ
ncbi:hypothetical protein TTHERM_00725900 (macronuclear) [Tetrahymena thermophila SB210]|uniref:Uncharacterized protein n=1 Tax=Tetrahymena thermophila (strain SB210) TaxID=312017 RepID=Q24GK0_TETTS|nr:hypothetical protein TTHERM_00725900 [Tetrahymena thermophila SB210]EAS06871.1 hypothetical protein TTHERM_00725900 [Tetrahymena thermophila SB210]|eukprot:XP_001027113.1 hypothetical protein TTHERM_00725900 [Tetrahymena thermophila SB210]